MIVRDRLVLTFFLLVCILSLPSLLAVGRLDDLRDLAVEDRARHAETAVALGRVQTGVAEVDRFLRSYVATPTSALEASLEAALAQAASATRAVGTSGYAEESSALRAEMERLAQAVPSVVGLVEEGRLDDATDRVLALDRTVEAVRREVVAVAAVVDTRAGEDFELADDIAASSQGSVILALSVALVLALILGIWTTRGLALPLARLGAAMAEVSDGEGFEAPDDLPYDRPDEIGALAESFRTMTQRLGELDRLKVEFLGVASHELKTPINVIRGYAELIEEELETDLTEGQADLLHRIAEQTQSMSRMVSRLMDISRLEAGNLGMETEPVLVQDILLGLERGFEILAQKKGVNLEIVQSPGTPERLEVDVDLIRDEVLGNLVSNALRFTPEGGTVRVEAGLLEGGLLVRVSDTGPGIPDRHRPYIFDRYYRGERTRGLGTGLGLAICRQVVEAHGGWVGLVGEGEAGAIFHVFVPLPG